MAYWRPFEEREEQLEQDAQTEEQWEFKNKDLHVQTQRLILNIYKNLKKEMNDKSENEIFGRIAHLTSLGHSTIYRVVKQGDVVDHSRKRKRKDQKLNKVDETTRDFIRRQVYDLYKKNEVPTLKSIKNKLSGYPEYTYKSLETLREILSDCGFKHKKLNQRMAIMESPRLVMQRQDYLRQIKDYRESKRHIVYLDETWFDSHDVIRYGWVDNSQNCCLQAPSSRGKRIIILHAGSENGFVPNALLLSAKQIKKCSADYHEDMTAPLFETWFSEQLLPNIPKNSVIVMDNASYHSRQKVKIPSKATKKEDILKFMAYKNLTIPQKATKEILLRIIKNENFEKEYVIDELCKNSGHSLLRLPPYYCVFNPIELVWAFIKNKLRTSNQCPNLSGEVVENVRRILSEEYKDLWAECILHVISKERDYSILPSIQPIIINLSDSSDSEDFDD